MIFDVDVHFENASIMSFKADFKDMEQAEEWLCSLEDISRGIHWAQDRLVLFNLKHVTGIIIRENKEAPHAIDEG